MTRHARTLSDGDVERSLTTLFAPLAEAAPLPDRLFDVPRRSIVHAPFHAPWRNLLRLGAFAATVAAAVLVVSAIGRISPTAMTTGSGVGGPQVSIMTDHPLRMRSDDAAAIALAKAQHEFGARAAIAATQRGEAVAPFQVRSVTAIAANRINEVVRSEGAPLPTSDVVWVVDIEGTFVAPETIKSETRPRNSDQAYFVIWDRDGSFDGWGW
jgi:hypothetical protein